MIIILSILVKGLVERWVSARLAKLMTLIETPRKAPFSFVRKWTTVMKSVM